MQRWIWERCCSCTVWLWKKGTPKLDDDSSVKNRSILMDYDIRRCRFLKSCLRSFLCQKEGVGKACMECASFYQINGIDSPLRKKIRQEPCRNTYNDDLHWHMLKNYGSLFIQHSQKCKVLIIHVSNGVVSIRAWTMCMKHKSSHPAHVLFLFQRATYKIFK